MTYKYYSLPFCHTLSDEDDDTQDEESQRKLDKSSTATKKLQGGIRHKQRLGESIVGDRRESSPYDISFLDSVDWRMLCKKTLQPDDLRKFKDAIHNNYFFEMFVEDLPMWVSFVPILGLLYKLSTPF